MQRFLILFALAALEGCAAVPAHDWKPRDTALELSWQVLNAADAATTARGIDRCPGAVEGNPIARRMFGRRPEARDVLAVAGMEGATHWVVSRLLPPKWRPYWHGGFIGMSGAAVANNLHVIGSCR